MGKQLTITDIKNLYPEEWVLLGNPIMDESKIDVLEGIPLFHSKDKKEVYEKLFIDDTSKIRLGTKKENGSGLGLFVTNDFIQLLQGTIHAVSKPGETVFSITLKKK